MRTVRVNCSVSYAYEVELSDDIDLRNDENIIIAVDGPDPVYNKISNTLHEAKLEYNGIINSVIDNDTGEILYEN